MAKDFHEMVFNVNLSIPNYKLNPSILDSCKGRQQTRLDDLVIKASFLSFNLCCQASIPRLQVQRGNLSWKEMNATLQLYQCQILQLNLVFLELDILFGQLHCVEIASKEKFTYIHNW